ncbi:MAG: MAPEG family protein [Gammaproteobacteria bacterium]
MIAPVTSLYASLLALLLLYLAYRIVKVRRSNKVGLGSGGDEAVEHAMRVMGNAVEYVPIALILIALLEINHTPQWMIHVYGAVLFAARLYHLRGFGSNSGISNGRYYGTLGTWLVIVLAALTNLVHFALWAT